MKITGSESLVMDVLWRADRPLAAEEIRAELSEDWTDPTVRTFLTRLVRKKVAGASRDGRRYLYRPLVQREDYVHAESKNLIDRLFGGQVGPFFAHFSRREALTDKDIAELERLVKELKDGR